MTGHILTARALQTGVIMVAGFKPFETYESQDFKHSSCWTKSMLKDPPYHTPYSFGVLCDFFPEVTNPNVC